MENQSFSNRDTSRREVVKKRFLCARDGSFSLADEGFLCDPEGEYGHLWNPDIVTFDCLHDARCLVVLGEPGIGKSTEFEKLIEVEKRRVAGTNDKVLDFRLREYDKGDFLCKDIFESDDVKEFKSGSHKLYLFLDDLDEGMLSVKPLASLLGSRLKKLPSERLYLRIACRTAEWPKSLEVSLTNYWDSEEIKVRELVPLRRKDVAEFVAAHEIDTEKFFSQIIEKEVVPLAIKPLTLKFLVKVFQKENTFPKTQVALYAEGCRLLCDESNPDRIAAEKRSPFSGDQLLAVAERIAAISIFSNRAAIWDAPDFGDVPDTDITVSRLCGGYEKEHGVAFQVTEAHIRDAIKTGLFNSRGLNRMGWAHQTYAEFLAACYLCHHEVPTSQKLGLLVHPNDDEERLVPQLHETAAWLAGMDKQLFAEILSRDPEALLRSDLSTVAPEARELLVEKLLTLLDEEKLLDKWELQHRYKKLEHPRLAEQLRRFICDSSKGYFARRVAIDIAEECNQKSLQHDLAEIILSELEPKGIKIRAAHALIKIGDVEVRARLIPLTNIAAKDDPDDELKGCALKATWPDVLSTQEVFSLLTYPQKRFFLGAYLTFLYDFSRKLTSVDVIPALEWVKRLNISSDSSDSFSTIRNRIINLSGEHADGESNAQTDAY